MTRQILFVLAVMLSLGTQLRAQAKDQIVVIVSIDGLAWYYFDDPKAQMPTIRAMAAEGARGTRMIASLPTVTWPNHTTLVTGVSPGKHGVIGNNYFDRAKNQAVPLIPDPLFNKDEIVKIPTIYDVAHGAGLKTAAIIWPASRGARTLNWTVPDVFLQKLWNEYGTPELLAECKAAGIPVDQQEVFCKTGKGRERDIMYTDMLIHTIKKHRPNLALLHLVEVDHVEHAKGPRTPEAYEVVKFEDDRIAQIKTAMEEAFPGKATLIVTSDHGFIAYRQNIQLNVKLRQAGLLKNEGSKVADADRKVFALAQGGASFIYVMDQANREQLIAQTATMFKDMEGVDLVVTPADYAQFGLADPRTNPHMADLVLTAKPGYSFGDGAAGDTVVTPTGEQKGSHGHSALQPDMGASFVAWGAGIRKGIVVSEISNMDVAPTAAAILGLEMKGVEGRVLKEILAK